MSPLILLAVCLCVRLGSAVSVHEDAICNRARALTVHARALEV